LSLDRGDQAGAQFGGADHGVDAADVDGTVDVACAVELGHIGWFPGADCGAYRGLCGGQLGLPAPHGSIDAQRLMAEPGDQVHRRGQDGGGEQVGHECVYQGAAPDGTGCQ
jgi:hypothetical protein